MKHVLRDIRLVLPSIVVWKIILILAALAAIPLIPLQYPMTAFRNLSYYDFGSALPYWIKIWGNFDGFYYLVISKDGYQPGTVPFFPLYPILIAAIKLFIDWRRLIIGQTISLISFVGALLLTYQLLRRDTATTKRGAFLFLLIVLTFPTAFFYTAIYNDSLFFFFASLTLYAAVTRRWILATCASVLATLTRLNGLALFPFLLVEYLTTSDTFLKSWNWQRLKNHIRDIVRSHTAWRTLAIFSLVPLAFVAYLTYIHIVFGDWNILFTAMKPWGQDRMILPPQVLWRYFKIIVLTFQPSTFVWWVALWELAAVVLYVSLLFYSWQKIRFSYWIFFAVSVLLPWFTGTFQGMPRYGLHLYPMYLALFLWLRKKDIITKIIYISIGLIIEFWALTLFTRGIFVA